MVYVKESYDGKESSSKTSSCNHQDVESGNDHQEQEDQREVSCSGAGNTTTWAVLFTHSGVATKGSGSVAEPSTRPMGYKASEKEPLLTSQSNKLLYDSAELAVSRQRTARQCKSLALVVAVVLVGAMCYSIQAPFYPAKAEQKGITASQYGFVFGVFQLIICITSPIYGKYIAVIGPTFMFNMGVFVTATCTVLFGFLDYSPPQTTFLVLSFAIRIVAAFGESGVYNAAYTLATDTSPTMVATAVSFVETAFGFGAILGPALGGVLFELGGFILPFVVTGGVLLLAGVVSTLYLPSVRMEEMSKKNRPGVFKALSIPGVVIMSLAIVTCSISSGFNLTLLEPHLRDFNLSAWAVGLVFITNGVVYAATATFWGRMIDKMGKTVSLTAVSSLVTTSSYLLFGPAPFIPLEKSLPFVIISLLLQGAGMGGMIVGAFMGTIHELIGNGFPSDLQTHGLASGIFNCAFSTGAFIGPSIAGTLFDSIGFANASSVILAILTAMTCVLIGYQVYLWKCSPRTDETKTTVHQAH